MTSFGGRWTLDDLGDTPDVQEAIWEFPDQKIVMTWTDRETSRGNGGIGLNFYGTKGSLSVNRGGFQTEADEVIPPSNTVPQFTGDHPTGGPERVPGARALGGDGPTTLTTTPAIRANSSSCTRRTSSTASVRASSRSRRWRTGTLWRRIATWRISRSVSIGASNGIPRSKRSSATMKLPICWCGLIGPHGIASYAP